MYANSPGAVSLSICLHAAVIGTLVWVSATLNRVPPITPTDIELVNLDDIELGEKTEVPGPADGPPRLRIRKPNIKAAPKPQPQPPAQQAEMREAPKTPTKPNAANNKPAPKGTTYDQFKSKNAGQLKQNAQATSNSRSTGKIQRVNSDRIQRELSEAGDRGPSGTGGNKLTLAAQDAYFARLSQALQMAFILPSGMSELLRAQVEFTLGADGSLTNIRVVKSSGEADFDRAVVEAFRKVRTIGPFPGGKGGTFSLNFSMSEE